MVSIEIIHLDDAQTYTIVVEVPFPFLKVFIELLQTDNVYSAMFNFKAENVIDLKERDEWIGYDIPESDFSDYEYSFLHILFQFIHGFIFDLMNSGSIIFLTSYQTVLRFSNKGEHMTLSLVLDNQVVERNIFSAKQILHPNRLLP